MAKAKKGVSAVRESPSHKGSSGKVPSGKSSSKVSASKDGPAKKSSSKNGHSGNGRQWLFPLLLCIATAIVFRHVLQHEFVSWDDDINVYENPYFQPITADSILRFWRGPYEGLYSPISYTVWAFLALIARTPAHEQAGDRALINFAPQIFHGFNLALHLANIVLIFLLLRFFLGRSVQKNDTGNTSPQALTDWAATAGAALFAVHPIQVEAVAWVSELRGLLSTFFSLLALYFYLREAGRSASIVEVSGFTEGGGARRLTGGRALAMLFFVLGILCKPGAVVVPLVALALDHWLLGRPVRQGLRSLAPWFAAACIGILVAKVSQPVDSTVVPTAWWVRPFIAGDALTFYGFKLLVPWPLTMDYGRNPQAVLQGPGWVYVAWLLPVGLGIWLWRNRQSWPWPLAAGTVFLTGLLPVLGLVPFQFQFYSTVADRYLYLSMLGPALLLGWLTVRYHSHLVRGVVVAGLLLLGLVASRQTLYWANTVSLMTHAIEVNSDAVGARINLALAEQRRGELSRATEHFKYVERIKPNYAPVQFNYANLLMQQGQVAEAIPRYRKAVELEPGMSLIRIRFASALSRAGQFPEAVKQYEEALRINPKAAVAAFNWGLDLEAQGRYAAAMKKYEQALRINPDLGPAKEALMKATFNSGIDLEKAGRIREAVEHYQQALEMAPGSPIVEEALQRAKSKLPPGA